MNRIYLGMLILVSLYFASCNQSKKLASPIYPVGVAFNSICCGTPSADFLKTFLIKYNNVNNTKLSADIAGQCGKEGEFIIRINNSTNSIKQDLIGKLTDLIREENEKNKITNPGAGYITLLGDPSQSDYEFCRLSLRSWYK